MQKLSPIEINEICEELGETYPKSIEQVHGGDIHNAWRIEFSNKKLFLKRNIRNKKFLEFEKYCLQNLKKFINQENLVLPEVIAYKNIENIEMDTFTARETFYSYRRSRLNNEKDYGRCISVILMT